MTVPSSNAAKTMRTPDISDIPPAPRAEVQRRLAEIERTNNVRILLAVESGSRAWGFASPDSDYDARFIYVHPLPWYLTLHEGRDVIETPIEDDMDVNGWDIRKALRLAVSHNPVLIEWLTSTIIYSETAEAEILRTFAIASRSRRALIRHYHGLMQSSWRRHLASPDRPTILLKRYFYAIRPAVALAWLQQRPEEAPPMTVPQLLAGIALPEQVVAQIAELRDLKAITNEMGEGSRRAEIDRFAHDQMQWAEDMLAKLPQDDRTDPAAADLVFRRLIGAA